jgi:crossover junction endodeoxyribonuclease RusA
MHLEFVVPGPPVSNQQSSATGRANLAAWRAGVRAEAARIWKSPPLAGDLKAVIINFFDTNKPSLDLDNMSKPVLDSLEELVYEDDRQVRQLEVSHVRINAPMVFAGASKVVVNAVQTGRQFVYVRIEDPVVPLPLPK